MKKLMNKTGEKENNDMRAEYDFTGGVRGKHYRAMQSGYSIIIHKSDGTTEMKDIIPKGEAVIIDPDVRSYFPDSESVNNALRCLIPLMPKTQKSKKKHADRSRVRSSQRGEP
jgi:hypothetical protein